MPVLHERPRDLDAALSLLAEGGWTMVSGGTDHHPALGDGPPPPRTLDLTAIEALRGIERGPTGWRIGARATWLDVIRADLPPAFAALVQAAREVGSVQIQSRASLAGNLCTASPAADGMPPLLALDASVELASARGRRVLPLARFVTGYRETALRPGEMVTAILIPEAAGRGASAFAKLGARRYLVISIAMAAARLAVEDGRIARAAVAVGACSPVACRLPGLEAALVGLRAREAAEAARAADLSALSPIDDVRAPAAYRREAAGRLVVEAVRGALGTGP